MANQTERWVQALTKGIPGNATPEDGLDPDSDYEAYNKWAEYIVEPLNLSEDDNEAYFSFMEDNGTNWANFIRETCGDDWGKLAQIVNEYGY